MANPAPSNQVANLLGTGGGNKANLTSFKPGERRVGRAKGTPNNLPELLRELFEAAADLGYMRQELVVDKKGNPEVGPDGRLGESRGRRAARMGSMVTSSGSASTTLRRLWP